MKNELKEMLIYHTGLQIKIESAPMSELDELNREMKELEEKIMKMAGK